MMEKEREVAEKSEEATLRFKEISLQGQGLEERPLRFDGFKARIDDFGGRSERRLK